MHDVQVAVIGAGAAGLAAAAWLRTAAVKCLILEARNRTGGRAHTDESVPGAPFDWGASYLHAVDQGNPWADIALTLREPLVRDHRRRVVMDRGAVLGPEGAATYEAAVEHAWRVIAAAAGQAVAGLLPRATPADRFAAAPVGPWLSGEDTERLDAADLAAARDGEDWLVPRGYGRLVRRFGAGLPVRLGCAVTLVRTCKGYVELETTQGRLRAGRAILTAALGVLADGRIRFEPPLPASVHAALDGLPMGNLTKLWIQLDGDPFCQGDGFYATSPPAGERAILYLVRPFGRAELMGFVGGSLARDLSCLAPAAFRAAVTEPLVAMLGAKVRAQVGACRASDWTSDPWALGSYAVAKPGAAVVREALRQPFTDRLHYAGEAAAAEGWHATVAGAYLSGRETARRLAGTSAVATLS